MFLLPLLPTLTASLQCYACGGHAPLKCDAFNASAPQAELRARFAQACAPGQLACRKGWVNSALPGEDPEVRSCTQLPETQCLAQNGGGSCSCVTDFCNEAAERNGVSFDVIILLTFVSLTSIIH